MKSCPPLQSIVLSYPIVYWIKTVRNMKHHLIEAKFVLLQNTGAGIFYNIRGSGRVLSKNGIIDITTLVVPFFRCLSGSSTPNVGSLIGPHGTDITFATSDPFLVIRGGSNDPGTLLVRMIRRLVSEDSGIYTYRSPDENGDIVEFHFGVYPSSNISKLSTAELTAIRNNHYMSFSQGISAYAKGRVVAPFSKGPCFNGCIQGFSVMFSILSHAGPPYCPTIEHVKSTLCPVCPMAPHPLRWSGRGMERGYTSTTPPAMFTTQTRCCWTALQQHPHHWCHHDGKLFLHCAQQCGTIRQAFWDSTRWMTTNFSVVSNYWLGCMQCFACTFSSLHNS